jgi:hypothetical protein
LNLLRLAGALILLLAGAPSQALADRAEARGWLAAQGFAGPTAAALVACHGYGCVHRAAIPVGGPWLARAGAVLLAGRGSAAAERQALREVVRVYFGQLAAGFGGRRDEPRSPPALSGIPGQMDCLDTTANVTSLLLVLEARGLLAHHQVEAPQSRGFFLDGRWPHYTAVISAGGQLFAVDPWTRRPGEPPDVLPLAAWLART